VHGAVTVAGRDVGAGNKALFGVTDLLRLCPAGNRSIGQIRCQNFKVGGPRLRVMQKEMPIQIKTFESNAEWFMAKQPVSSIRTVE
jgi:hypothetical protein